jgi:hypothetical protein
VPRRLAGDLDFGFWICVGNPKSKMRISGVANLRDQSKALIGGKTRCVMIDLLGKIDGTLPTTQISV